MSEAVQTYRWNLPLCVICRHAAYQKSRAVRSNMGFDEWFSQYPQTHSTVVACDRHEVELAAALLRYEGA